MIKIFPFEASFAFLQQLIALPVCILISIQLLRLHSGFGRRLAGGRQDTAKMQMQSQTRKKKKMHVFRRQREPGSPYD